MDSTSVWEDPYVVENLKLMFDTFCDDEQRLHVVSEILI